MPKNIKINFKLIQDVKPTIEGILHFFNSYKKRLSNTTVFHLFSQVPDLVDLKLKTGMTDFDLKYDFLNNRIPYPRYCNVCGKLLHVNPNDILHGYPQTCSRACTAKDPLRSAKLSKAAHTEEIVQQRIKATKITCLQKYGSDFFITSKKGKEKIKNILTDKYGVDNVFKLKEFQDKAQQTNLNKYGVKVAILNPAIKAKAEATMLSRYGVKSYSMLHKKQ